MNVDLLVVGGGLAGYCAALEAASRGAEVMLVEKEGRTGGATVLSGGSFAFAGTPLQKQHGIDDSDERLYDDLRRVGGNENDEALVRAYVSHQREAYDWLALLGVRFERLFIASGQTVPRGHSRNAREVLDVVEQRARETGRVGTKLNTRARRLTRDEATGKVTGALVEHAGVEKAIHARLGVVIATGGFSRSESLLKLFAPQQALAQRMGGPGNTGDGLLMAWRLGAGFRDMGYIKGTFGNHVSAGPEDHFLLFAMYAGGIIVNTAAKRFADESLSYKLIGEACIRQPGAIGFQVFDQPIFERGVPGVPSMDFQADLEAGRVVKADTLAQLAAMLALDPVALQATVDRYNAMVKQGRDEDFGRDGLCNHFGALATIGTAPFYGFAAKSVVLATYCGLTVDASMNVRDVYGDSIPGLYAAGGCIGGFHGRAYMTGTANGKATIFGRIAARSALKT
ncbi:MAG: FAD-dependent oxidoreductase [Usitatibacter sp.]